MRDAVRPESHTNPEPDGRYHLVVIGAGTAGLVAAAGAAGLGARVALVERKLLGGDCLNAGCVPSKGMIAASRVAASARDAERFGVGVGGVSIDFAAAMNRMRRLRADIAPNDSVDRFASLGVDVYLGDAEFLGGDRVTVTGEAGDRELRFRRALVATGARPAAPAVDGFDAIEYLTNETVFSLTEAPASLAVLGAGPIGCELSQAMARLGVSVTLLADGSEDATGLLPADEPDAG
ncbi:MAG: FAD-dependent oxidoreductase, partial [Planctomycetota bacterium]